MKLQKFLPSWLKSRIDKERGIAKQEEIVYKFDTIVSFDSCLHCKNDFIHEGISQIKNANGPVNVNAVENATINLTVVVQGVDQLRDILMQYHIDPTRQSFRLVKKKETITDHDLENPLVTENDEPTETETDIRNQLSSDPNAQADVVNVTSRTDEDGNVHLSLELRIIKMTFRPCCRFNTVVVLVALFLSLATVIIILYFKFVLDNVRTRKKIEGFSSSALRASVIRIYYFRNRKCVYSGCI